jgi:chemotaxis protein MotB
MSHRSTKRHRQHGGHEEEHENHERWLVTYADMLTLLMVLFIVMFAMSTVDKQKFADLADGLASGFGAPSVAFSGKTAPLEGSGNSTTVIPIDPGANPGLAENVKTATPAQEKLKKEAVAQSERAKAFTDAQAAAREVANLKEIERKIAKALAAHKLLDSVRFTIDERGLVVTVVTNQVVFAGDRAELLAGGREILDAVLPPLRGLPNNIEVDGHTNQLRVQTRNYPSGWELSSARAASVVRYLIGRGVAERRCAAAGFADTRPLIKPSDPRSVTMNRRVDIVVLSSLPAAQRALLPSAAK